MKRKLICALACRNQGSRLYGKPLQNLHVKKNIRVIDYIIQKIKKIVFIDEIVLAISDNKDNFEYFNIAKKNNIKTIVGSEIDVLKRLIQACESVNGTDVYRVTSESPFIFDDVSIIKKSWINHKKKNLDFTFMTKGVIDGCGYEIINLLALKRSHKNGKKKHRSELCSLYIRENKEKFNIEEVESPYYLKRDDLRLTIDYPEDLILCREIFNNVKYKNLKSIINFIDANKFLKGLCKRVIKNEI